MGNEQRRLRTRIYEARRSCPPPIMGLDFVNLITKLVYYVDYGEYIETLRQFAEELESRNACAMAACDADRPRILWTGLGNSLGCNKVLRLVEEAGGVVVCQEGCGGVTRTEDLIDESLPPFGSHSPALSQGHVRVHDAQHRTFHRPGTVDTGISG